MKQSGFVKDSRTKVWHWLHRDGARYLCGIDKFTAYAYGRSIPGKGKVCGNCSRILVIRRKKKEAA